LGSHGSFELRHLWYLSVATVTPQAVLSLILVQQQFQQRLGRRPQAAVG
jgi:hypothetical protein